MKSSVKNEHLRNIGADDIAACTVAHQVGVVVKRCKRSKLMIARDTKEIVEQMKK